MQDQTFEEQIRIENRSRNKKWQWERHLREVRGEDIYTDFCVWCNCQGQPELKTNARVFAEMFSLKVSTVNTILIKSRLNRKRPKHNYKQFPLCEKTQQIITEIKSGKPLHEIAKAHGTSRQYVHRVKNKCVKEQQNER